MISLFFSVLFARTLYRPWAFQKFSRISDNKFILVFIKETSKMTPQSRHFLCFKFFHNLLMLQLNMILFNNKGV